MHTRHVCPKCSHNHILLIENVADLGESTVPSKLQIAITFQGEGWLGVKTGSAGEVSAAVCRACGYTELRTRAPETIPVDSKYVREVIGPETTTPYR